MGLGTVLIFGNRSNANQIATSLQTLNTAVVQIYKTEGNAHSHWKKKHTGVVCFVKDSAIRSYFLRAYCLIKNELIWEHEIYDGMQIVKSRPFLLTFEGSVSGPINQEIAETYLVLFSRTATLA